MQRPRRDRGDSSPYHRSSSSERDHFPYDTAPLRSEHPLIAPLAPTEAQFLDFITTHPIVQPEFQFACEPVVKICTGKKKGTSLDCYIFAANEEKDLVDMIFRAFLPHLGGRVIREDGKRVSIEPFLPEQQTFANLHDRIVFTVTGKLCSLGTMTTAHWAKLTKSYADNSLNRAVVRVNVYGEASSAEGSVLAELVAPIDSNRAGAPSENAVEALSAQLEARFGAAYRPRIANGWRMLATLLQTKSIEERSSVLEGVVLPPPYSVHFYPETSLNSYVRSVLPNNRAAIDAIELGIQFSSDAIARMTEHRTTLIAYRSSLLSQNSAYEDLLAQGLAERVTDQIDVDHGELPRS